MPEELSPLDDRLAELDRHLEHLRQHLPRPEPQPAPPPPEPVLKCPACGGELQRGVVSVHGTFWGFLVVGLSHQDCWFQPAGSEAEVVVVPSGCAKDGWQCPDCGFTGIKGGEARPGKMRLGDV